MVSCARSAPAVTARRPPLPANVRETAPRPTLSVEGEQATAARDDINHLPVPPRFPTEVTSKAKRRRLTAEHKTKVQQEADACTESGQIGALLRREGLYSSHLVTWRAARRLGMRRPEEGGRP
jgi:hypothetical protein